jgi:hypothetical protein
VRPTLIYEDNLACIDMSIHNDKIPRKNVWFLCSTIGK